MTKTNAIFTGTFDPFHRAHGWQLERAYKKHPFDTAIVKILATNPEKPFIQAVEHRVKLAQLTLQDMQVPFAFVVEPIQDNMPSTLRDLKAAQVGAEVIRIMGADSYIEFLEEPTKREVLQMFHNVVVERPAVRAAQVLQALEAVPANERQLIEPELVEIDQAEDVSARNFRADIQSARDAGLVTDSAFTYIKDNNLYT